jgi:hypothetical protein
VTRIVRPELDAVRDLLGDARPVRLAEIHGTVDLERRLVELGQPANIARGAVDDRLLGARVVVIERGGEPAIALAEPTTEGRLAAALARLGEGQVGEYIALPAFDTLEAVRGRAREIGIALSSPGSGPFGSGVIVLGGAIGGYQVIVLEHRSLPSAG